MTSKSICILAVVGMLGVAGIASSDDAPTSSTIRGTVTYETGFDFEDYNAIRQLYSFTSDSLRGWGEHPLIWKHIINPTLEFDPGPWPFGGAPHSTYPDFGDAARLNTYEASGLFKDSGVTVDPSGHWVETVSLSGSEAAVLAAIAIWKWNTPVHIGFGYNHPDPLERFGYAGVIDSVTLSVPSGVPHEVCGWDDPDPSTSCPGLVIESVKMTHYTSGPFEDPVSHYYDSPPFTGSAFVTGYNGSFWFSDGVVVWDPPASSLGEVTPQLVESLSRAQGHAAWLRQSDGTLIPSR